MVFVIAIVAGFLFGGADQYLGSLVTLGTWTSSLSGMSAPWLVLPFVLGCTHTRARRAALLGLTVTFSALIGYFVMTLSPVEGVLLSRVNLFAFLHSQDAIILGGLLTGPLFGLLGQRWRVERAWLSAMLVAGAVCFEPAARSIVGRLPPPNELWAFECALGIALALGFVASGMTYRRRSRRSL